MATEIPVPFEERFEFLDDQCLDQAREFLEKRVAEYRDELRGVSFVISENFTDPPPHLGLGELASWVIRFEDGRVSVERASQPLESADIFILANYDRALSAASTIYGDDPQTVERAQREAGHLLRRTGAKHRAAELPPVLAKILGPLHDFLAKRQLTNPDLDHRIRHLGLEQNRAELDETGYTIIRNAISSKFADELRAEVRKLCYETSELAYTAAGLIQRGRIFEIAALQPHVMALAEHLLGRGLILTQSIGLRRPPGLDSFPGLHADMALIAEPFPEFCVEATSIWALDDFTPDAGPTVLVPGSFRYGKQVPEDVDQSDAIPLLMEKGSIAIWHGATWHGSKPREADGERITIHNSYGRVFIRTFDDFINIDPEIVERNPPGFTTICGLDDSFQKNSLRGSDQKKFRYAQAQRYGA